MCRTCYCHFISAVLHYISNLKITCWGCLVDVMVRVGQLTAYFFGIFFFLPLISGVSHVYMLESCGK